MTRYFKACRVDGTDFRTGTVHYRVGERTTHPSSTRRSRNDPSTYLSVSTVPTNCVGMRWPCRLFVVEGVGRPMRHVSLPTKRCFLSVDVVEERPAWEVFGPHGQDVVWVIERCKTLTAAEATRLRTAWDAAWGAAWDAAWDAARAAVRDAAWDAARAAVRDAARAAVRDAARAAVRDAARGAAWDAAWGAAAPLVVRDLITPNQFDLLYGPWRSVIGDPPERSEQ